MSRFVNRAKMSTATTGTGTVTLGSAAAGFQSFAAAGVVDQDTLRYVIEENNAWEIGYGVYSASGTTLTRNATESSNAGAALNLGGSANVYVAFTGDSLRGVASTAGKTVCLFGDSITNHNSIESGGTGLVKSPQGWFTFANALLRQRLAWPLGNNKGVSGDTSTQGLARYATDVAPTARDLTTVHFGANDVTNSIDKATTWANLKAIYGYELAAGKTVVAITPLPRTNWTGGWTTAQQTAALNQLLWVRNQIIEYCLITPGMVLVDPWRFFTDPTVSSGLPLGNGTSIPFYTVDNLHPAPAGAFVIGYLLARALAGHVPFNESVVGGAADVYSATDNPTGNLLTNGMLAGTSGTLGSAAVAGSVATSWKVSYSGSASGSPVTCSIESTRTDGASLGITGQTALTIPGPRQVIAVSESSGGSNDQVFFAQTVSSNFSPGDVLVAEIEIDVSNIANMTGLGLTVNDLPGDGTTAARHWDLGQYATNRGFNTQAWNGVLRTFPFTVVASLSPGPHTLTFQVAAFFNASSAAASATIKVSNASLRKIPVL